MNTKILNKKKKKEIKKKFKLIDKLFLRIFFSSIVLLLLTISSSFNLSFKNIITNNLNKNINFLKISTKINQIFNIDVLNKGDIYVYNSTVYDEVIFDNDINYVRNYSYAGVDSLTDGVVIKIIKNKGLYTVTIQSLDDTLYCYEGLESIEVQLYKYVKANDVIGKSILNENLYQFKLKIVKNDKLISYYENAED